LGVSISIEEEYSLKERELKERHARELMVAQKEAQSVTGVQVEDKSEPMSSDHD
jgi:hypothetical protein